MRCFGAFALMGLMASAWHPAACTGGKNHHPGPAQNRIGFGFN